MSFESAKQTFQQEATELLAQMEDALLSLEADPGDAELLHQVFRAMHTIKGTAGVFGFDPVVTFTHTVETVMDDVRSGERQLDPRILATLLECKDHTAALVEEVLAVDDPADMDPSLIARGEALIAQLTGTGTALAPAEGGAEDAAAGAKGEEIAGDHWIIDLQFGPDALRNGMDPLSFLRYLRSLGEIVQIFTQPHRLPDPEHFDPESCYLSFQVFFKSDADKRTIEDVFEFAEDDCDIAILPPDSQGERYRALLDQLPEDEVQRVGEMLIQVGALTPGEVDRALSAQQEASAEDPEQPAAPLGEILVDQKTVQGEVLQSALDKQEKTRQKVAQESRYIRVDAVRLGHLINLVGELVINSAAMQVTAERHALDDLTEVVEGVDRLVEEIRDNALQLRMVQIGETFNRFRRVVRDTSKELGKDIDLIITGGETEVDKTVVEKINDPLTHLVRNSVDHGIESPEVRRANGKPAKGTVSLNAFHDSGHIVIQVKDDGAGLDPERLRAKAEAKGLVRPDQTLTKEETLRLIFEPGLSTKEQASNLSGRGVGMDVVRRNIEALRGTVELESELGEGTTVTVILPLTLAIIDGFLVGAGGEQYVIPLAQVVECVEVAPEARIQRHGKDYINLRGEVLPYLRLKEFFDLDQGDGDRRESLVVVRFGHTKAGLVVDDLYGELQTVIKPIGKVFENLQGIAGATVLGTGEIALILDSQELTAVTRGRTPPPATAHTSH